MNILVVAFRVVRIFYKWGKFSMKVQMKRCVECRALLNKSLKLCTKCGSRELEEGFYERESKNSVEFNKYLNDSHGNIVSCPVCGAGVTTKSGFGECSFCGDEISSDGSSFYWDYIDDRLKKD